MSASLRAVLLLSLALVTSIAGLLTVILVGRPAPASLAPAQGPVMLAVSVSSSDLGDSAELVVSPGQAGAIRSGGGSGVVTRVYVKEGTTIKPGARLFRLKGRDVYLVQHTEPFYRELKPGMRGPDVKALQRFLADRLDRTMRIDGHYGAATERAFRMWARSTGAPEHATFDPAHFYAAPGPIAVSDVAVQPGQVVPTTGEKILDLAGNPQVTKVVSATLPIPSVRDYRFVTDGLEVTLTWVGEAWSTPDASQLSAVLRAVKTDAPSPGSTRSLSGYLSLARERPVVAVPALSIVTSATGSSCVVVRDAADAPLVALPVQTLGVSPSGEALLDPAQLTGKQVLVNPASQSGVPPCP